MEEGPGIALLGPKAQGPPLQGLEVRLGMEGECSSFGVLVIPYGILLRRRGQRGLVQSCPLHHRLDSDGFRNSSPKMEDDKSILCNCKLLNCLRSFWVHESFIKALNTS
ncbi:ER membrane protein complex subunit 2-like [Pyrus ussuriensis x Pyrus communis]|uniref:ER membrane protein complex subunit 2-like n=1 Tax=Pyrus ussuriensis x Pyrus communis TaxID=2448454 RepID=A0A5N5HF27_9ROSA|nr:ER membrane protein complex subunit 2-like [Pyrus ussuriensis x Pyrus communis]